MVARWYCYVVALENGTRSSIKIEWIKHAKFWEKEKCGMLQKRTGYMLQIMATDSTIDKAPPLGGELDIESFLACNNSMMLVLEIEKSRWGAEAKHAKENNFPVHGLKGKTGNKNKKNMAWVDLDLRDFFENLLDEAEVPATRLVRELTCVGLCAGEEDKI